MCVSQKISRRDFFFQCCCVGYTVVIARKNLWSSVLTFKLIEIRVIMWKSDTTVQTQYFIILKRNTLDIF